LLYWKTAKVEDFSKMQMRWFQITLFQKIPTERFTDLDKQNLVLFLG